MDNFSNIEDDGDNPGGAAGCAAIAGLLALCAASAFLAWILTQWQGGIW